MNLKDKILDKIGMYDYVTFAELSRIDGFSGEFEMVKSEFNIVLWQKMSEEAIDAISELIKSDLIQADTAQFITYAIDGMFLDMPIAQKINYKYKKPRWLPLVFRPTEKGKQLYRDKIKPMTRFDPDNIG